jgi:hypothetical protein
MAKHFELTEPFSIHPAAFVGVTDPSIDPDNFVEPNKFWVDTTGGPPYALKIRNVTNTAWEDVSGSGSSSSVVMGPPGFAEEGEHGEIGVPGNSGVAGAAGSIAEDGWIAAGETWTFDAADAPTFTFKITGSDLTAKYTPGTKLKLTHSAAVKYFIVTASAFAAGDTTVTVYGGTDYTLAAGAITLPFFSRMKGPAGFPLSSAKWTVTTTSTSNVNQATPTAGTWYNLGSLSITIPIGIWRVEYFVNSGAVDSTSVTGFGANVTLSTGAASETDKLFSGFFQVNGITVSGDVYNMITRAQTLTLAAKTQYFLNAKSGFNLTSLEFRGDISTTLIQAICDYL